MASVLKMQVLERDDVKIGFKHPHPRDKVGMASVVDKMRKRRLRWLGHVKRKSAAASE